MSEITETAPETGSIAAATSAFEAILAGDELDNQEEQEEVVEPQEEPTPEETPAESDDEAPEAEQDEEPKEDEPEEKEAETPESVAAITVEIDGKDVELTKEEVQASYLRQADYTRKTQALAEEKRNFASELEEARRQAKVYAELLPAMFEQMQTSLPKEPDVSLIDTDPQRYLKEQKIYERKVGDLKAAEAESLRLKEESEQENLSKLQAYVQSNAEKITELVPEWKDKAAYDRDRSKIRDYLGTKGFSDEEISQAYDARIVAMAYDAMRWRELKNSKPKAAAPLEKAIKTSPPPARPVTVKSRVYVEDKKRLAQTGSIKDAAKVFESML
jgi:hypothetical protein